MSDLSNYTFTGRLTKNARLKTTPNGTQLLEASVAVNTGYGDYAKTLYLKIVLWGKRASSIIQYMTKAMLVAGTGELSVNEYTDKYGVLQKENIITLNSISLLGDRSKSSESIESAEFTEEQQLPKQSDSDVEELPF